MPLSEMAILSLFGVANQQINAQVMTGTDVKDNLVLVETI
jgi:hypothetical protein